MGDKLSGKEKKIAREFEKQGKKIFSEAKKQGLIAINNRSKLFIDGRPARRWWFADKKTNLLISVEFGLCADEALAMLERNRKSLHPFIVS
jgi:hypothetical protein